MCYNTFNVTVISYQQDRQGELGWKWAGPVVGPRDREAAMGNQPDMWGICCTAYPTECVIQQDQICLNFDIKHDSL